MGGTQAIGSRTGAGPGQCVEMATPPWIPKTLTWRGMRFVIIIIAIYWGSFYETGLFSHTAKEPKLPRRYHGCEAQGLYTNSSCKLTCRAQANSTAFEPLPPHVLQTSQSCHWCKDWSGGDTLFEHIMALHDGLPAASALDAGTGVTSLGWISRELRPKRWSAVTANHKTANLVQNAKMRKRMREHDEVVVGNWQNDTLLQGQKYDLILADYLFGAIDGYAPYYQEQILPRLQRHMAPGGRIYVVGKDPAPHPSRFPYQGKPAYHIFHGVHQVEDVDRLLKACITHAADRTFREFPLSWVVAHAQKAGFKVEAQHAFPAVYGTQALHAQMDVCEHKLGKIEGRHLLNGIKERIAMLRKRIDENVMIKNNGVCYGVDYVVALSLPSTRSTTPT